MNIQRKNSAHHFRMQSDREQTLIVVLKASTILNSFKGILFFFYENTSKLQSV